MDSRKNPLNDDDLLPSQKGGYGIAEANDAQSTSIPPVSLPTGGGAIKGIGEKFAANPVTGTGSLSIPIPISPGRSGFTPQLTLSYDSGAGNGVFGFGWNLSVPAITRKTDKGLPRYQDEQESDVFILSGVEDLVPMLDSTGELEEIQRNGFRIRRYRPRIEGLFARIERWTDTITGDIHWRSTSKDNITTIYGKDSKSRIADPQHPAHIFSWLICESYDDKGNAICYRYKEEDSTGINTSFAQERNRTSLQRSASRYLKRIQYGNRVSRLVQPDLSAMDWLFEVVFDYGEHGAVDLPLGNTALTASSEEHDLIDKPKPSEERGWFHRPDPFSTYRAGFEVRTYRLCRRVLMFHHFPNEAYVGRDCLVRSTNFRYDSKADLAGLADVQNPVYSRLRAVSQLGYKRQPSGGYVHKKLPPLEFTYSEPGIDEKVRELHPESLESLPEGLDGTRYQWVDLDGEGLSGILTEQGGQWFYKRNLSPLNAVETNGAEHTKAQFGNLEQIGQKPAVSLTGGAQFADLAGDGQLDIVTLRGTSSGFYERDAEQGWASFVPFQFLPTLDWENPNLRFIDLNGDGHSDILITENDCFIWHPSLAETGFDEAERISHSFDEEQGPRVVFADHTQSIYVADMSGDGLTDIVRIRNGEVCYWPNLGYGRFGAKVTMDNAPWFDTSELFAQQRILLADIDGSGTTDILYLSNSGIQVYFNQSGNSWSAKRVLGGFPAIDTVTAVAAIDLLGNGTACLVWSSALPGNGQRVMRYIDLMGGQKPHLLLKSVNNLGAETVVQYAPSTKFYLQDKLAGKPWITKLPFPVHVVERVETYDHISRNRFVTRYAYHHGYFDGVEREFRGFGMIERWDTEAFEDYVVGVQAVNGNQTQAPELYQPPVLTRTWYHTGAFANAQRILHQYWQEYYQATQQLTEPLLPADLTAQELRECFRALKGLPLRQEIYSFDGSAQEAHPYTVTENNFEIRLIQPRRSQRHAVFFPIGRETISLNYERNPADPRISHSFNLEVDDYGNSLKSCSVAYGRRTIDATLPSEVTRDQQRLYVTYNEVDYTADIRQAEPETPYRLKVPYEQRAYEITGVSPTLDLFQLGEIREAIAATTAIAYESMADGTPQKRRLAQSRIRFLDNNLNPLPLGQWDTLGLTFQTYRLALTPSVVGIYYAGKVSDDELIAAGYVHSDGDADWWMPSGTAIYPANAADRFYLPIGTQDPMGLETLITLDPYDLLVERVQIRQATWAETVAVNDYRTLGPVMMTDPNQNRSAVEIDPLGMVVKSAVMGKAGAGEGDTLADPTVRMEYELFNWMDHGQPNFVHTFAREQHGAANPRWQESYAYSNGSGGVAMVKAQANPGKALQVDANGSATEVDANPRWIGNGRTILNNKGKGVKQYEPFFSTTHEYEDERALRELGVTAIRYYDAVGRNIRTVFPNQTLARVEFDPWTQRVFDANDTVKESQWYRDRGSPDPATEPEPLNNSERRAAWLAAKHANTPGTIHFDSLGRSTYAISDYGGGKTAAVRSESDLTGRFSRLFDQEQREVASGFMGMAGQPIMSDSAEKGGRRTFLNVLGALVKTWDEHGREFRTDYDELQRPLSTFVKEQGASEVLFSYVVYGDRHPNAQQLNLLGVAHQVFDQAGQVNVPELDFKGNPKRIERILAGDYRTTPDWSVLPAQSDYAAIQTAAAPLLETNKPFTASSLHDSLNRPTQVTLPDGTVILPTYNEANFLASLRAQIRGQGAFIEFLQEQDYDAKGQRQFAHYGNDVFTRYFYDPDTFRLTNLLTYKSGRNPDTQSLQNLHYTYDPIGNITQTRDDAQQTHYFNNAVVRPESLFEYDAVYQLIRATGREHASLSNNNIRNERDLDFVSQLPHANNATAVRTYTEEYEYDLLGNIQVLRHHFQAQAGAGNGWTRRYRYAYEDDPSNRTNRLSATSLPGDADTGQYSDTYDYDAYGNMTRMPHLSNGMTWDFMDQLRQINLGGGGTAYYVYSMGGQRIRKVIERNGNSRTERIYLGAVEIYREWVNNVVRFRRETVHIADDTGRIAQVDTKLQDDNNRDPDNPLNTALIRYQYGNHLGSAMLETDDTGSVISYEEYHPYGTSAYRSAKPGFDLSLKRYRFSGKERDDETGLYYFGARYYAAWLGRWISSDPAGFVDGFNSYCYCSSNPISKRDLTGLEGERIYGLGPGFAEDIHSNTPEAKSRIEEALTGRIVEENGVLYQIERPTLEWRGGNIGWYFNAKASDISVIGETITFENDAITASPSASATPQDSDSVPTEGQAGGSSGSSQGSQQGSTQGEPGGATGSSGSGRSFFTSSFFRGLAIGIGVTFLAVAVIATAGAAAPAIAAAAGVSASTAAAVGSVATTVGTVAGVAGAGATAYSIGRSIRQEDFFGNPISEDEANYNLGLGIGSFVGAAGGAAASGRITKFGAKAGKEIGEGATRASQAAAETLQSIINGGQLVPIGAGNVGGGAAVTTIAGVSTTSALTIAGTAMGTHVMMMEGSDGNGARGREFYDLDDAASAALGEEATVVSEIGDIGPVKNAGVRANLESLGYNPDEFRAVQYWARAAESGRRYIITLFEAGGVYYGPHISSANY